MWSSLCMVLLRSSYPYGLQKPQQTSTEKLPLFSHVTIPLSLLFDWSKTYLDRSSAMSRDSAATRTWGWTKPTARGNMVTPTFQQLRMHIKFDRAGDYISLCMHPAILGFKQTRAMCPMVQPGLIAWPLSSQIAIARVCVGKAKLFTPSITAFIYKDRNDVRSKLKKIMFRGHEWSMKLCIRGL